MIKYAFIPARGGSKGLPGKNIKCFLGEPLITRTIRIARESDIFDGIIVNTDDSEIAKIATEAGGTVVFREDDMGSDTAEIDPLIIWTVKNHEKQFPGINDALMCLLYSTAPLRSAGDIIATQALVDSGEYDSSLSLCETSDYLWARNEDVFTPQNYDPVNRASRQTEKWNQFKENKAVYCFKTKEIDRHKCRLYGRVGAYLMPQKRSVDVDTLDDFELAEALASRYAT